MLFLNFLNPCIDNVDLFSSADECAVNGSLWTIKFELIFYTILPFLFLINKYIKDFFRKLIISTSTLLAFSQFFSIYWIISFCFLNGVGLSMTRNSWGRLYKNIKEERRR